MYVILKVKVVTVIEFATVVAVETIDPVVAVVTVVTVSAQKNSQDGAFSQKIDYVTIFWRF